MIVQNSFANGVMSEGRDARAEAPTQRPQQLRAPASPDVRQIIAYVKDLAAAQQKQIDSLIANQKALNEAVEQISKSLGHMATAVEGHIARIDSGIRLQGEAIARISVAPSVVKKMKHEKLSVEPIEQAEVVEHPLRVNHIEREAEEYAEFMEP